MHDDVHESDASLVLQARNGDRPAFEHIVRRHGPSVYSFLRRRCSDRARADDAFQTAFLRAWQRIDQFDPQRGSLITWLLVLAGGASRDLERSERRWHSFMCLSTHSSPNTPRTRLPSPGDDSGQNDSALDRPQETGRPEETGRGIWGLVDRLLSSEEASALWLRYAHDLEPAQIALVLGRSKVRVRVMLLRARRTLRTALDRQETAASDLSHTSKPSWIGDLG